MIPGFRCHCFVASSGTLPSGSGELPCWIAIAQAPVKEPGMRTLNPIPGAIVKGDGRANLSTLSNNLIERHCASQTTRVNAVPTLCVFSSV